MSTFHIALKNFKKNVSFYLLYLISIALVITIYFAFTSFSMNQMMLEKMSTNGRVESMCQMISLFLVIFVIFYMSYSNRFFLRRRSKELGIYALLGYRKSTVLSLLTFENSLICFVSSIFGILFGGLAHKGIVIMMSQLLKLNIDYSILSLIDLKALRQTVLFICIIIIVLSLSNAYFLYKTSLMQLVRFEKQAEKIRNFKKIPALLGLFMISIGYLLALDILKVKASLWFKIGFYIVGFITMCLVITGTVLFITSFLPYIIQKSKTHKKSFLTYTKIIILPNFIYRIRSNSKTLIILTLLSAAVLTVSSVMALTLYYPIAAIDRIAPSEIEFKLTEHSNLNTIYQLINAYTTNQETISKVQTDIYKVTSSSDNLPLEYHIGTDQNQTVIRTPGFECISYSQYITLLKAQNKTKVLKTLSPLQDNKCILMKYQVDKNDALEVNKRYTLTINHQELPIDVQAISYDNVISFANSIGTLIISDSLYETICSYQEPIARIISLNGSALHDNEALYEALSNYLDADACLQSNFHRIHEIWHLNSSTFLLISFLVVLFFIAVGSILYFNNLSSMIDSKSDYEILDKMGYTQAQIKQILKKQIRIFYSIPFLLGLIDCLFATLVFKIGLMQNLLKPSFVHYIPTVIGLFIAAFIYSIYYYLTVKSCYKVIFN